jgi:membrane protease YdiL (CAAX protease family)
MSIIKNETGQIRLIWRLILTILLYTIVAILLRFIPIRLLSIYLVGHGLSQKTALDRASEIILENPVWAISLGILFGLLGLLIVWFLLSKIEKTKFTWRTVGLDWRRNSILMVLIGILVAGLIYFGYALSGSLLKGTDLILIPVNSRFSIPGFFEKLVLYLTMGFGEEIVFRGYIQTRLVKQVKVIGGIFITALIFVLLHQVFYSLSLITIISGVLLWFTIGLLYYLSKSLYLTIAIHGGLNLLMNTLTASFDDLDSMIVHAVILICVVVVGILSKKVRRLRRDEI